MNLDYKNAKLVMELVGFFGARDVNGLELILKDNPNLEKDYADQIEQIEKKIEEEKNGVDEMVEGKINEGETQTPPSGDNPDESVNQGVLGNFSKNQKGKPEPEDAGRKGK